jgi:uncharacterized protein (DUF2236 family)
VSLLYHRNSAPPGIVRPDVTIALPFGLQGLLDRGFEAYLRPPGLPAIDFARPAGEAGLAGPDSVSWQVFRNPLSLYIGGIAAVILELAEPRVRAGVWLHTSFRTDPLSRLQRTGLAAMVTVYGARSVAEPMIAGVVRAHASVSGTTDEGLRYHANDPELLTWVQATATYGFVTAHHRFVAPLSPADRDRYYAEGVAAGRLYGVPAPPASESDIEACFAAMRPRLAPSPIMSEFLRIMSRAAILPPGARLLQPLLVRAAVSLLPGWARTQLELGAEWQLGPGELKALRAAARLAHRLRIGTSPAAQACVRLGLPLDYLHGR